MNVPHHIVLKLGRIDQFPFDVITDLWLGILHRYPICCIAHFCLDTALGRLPNKLRVDASRKDGDGVFIPCGFHASYREGTRMRMVTSILDLAKRGTLFYSLWEWVDQNGDYEYSYAESIPQ